VRTGLVYLRGEDDSHLLNSIYNVLRIVRDLNISNKCGFEIDFGFIFVLSYDDTKKGTYDPEFESGTDMIMGYFFGLGFFYRL